MFGPTPRTRSFFEAVTARPRIALALTLVLVGLAASGLGRLVKDTSIKAFIPPDHPAVLADERAAAVFGLSDAIAVAARRDDGGSVFDAGFLRWFSELADQLAEVPNLRPDRITSLASESSILGDDGALLVEPYVTGPDLTDAEAADSAARWRQMPPHRGTLVSGDESGAVILAELEDTRLAADTYEAVMRVVEENQREGVSLHVAGRGAVSGYLARYIDRDARKLQPLVFVIVLTFIWLAFRRARALPGPLLVVLAAAGGSLGIMGWTGVPYYAITNALPVIVVAISVADAIHVLSACYQYRERNPEASVREVVVTAMTRMARPITLTSLTTIAGFVGIAVVSVMPPITWFAWFAALGVALAWAASIFALPNLLVLVPPGRSPAFRQWRQRRLGPLGVVFREVGSFAQRHWGWVLLFFALQTAVAVAGALQLRVDRSTVDNFAPGEPIRTADSWINEAFAGTAFLDVVVETDAPEGLLDARRMRKISELQDFFESLPGVTKTLSIADYVGLMHRALGETEGSSPGHRELPAGDDAIAQYLLLYEVSADPTDFEEEIDGTRSLALVRGILDRGHFSEQRPVVESVERYLRQTFNEPGMSARLAGDVNVGYHWMTRLKISHFESVALSLALVLVMSALVFRSAVLGLIAVTPVLFTVLVLYASMGFLGIYLEPATSMFAAIALGVGVDFAIHLVDRLRSATEEQGGDFARAVEIGMPPVARACFYNSAALGVGFAVLLVSDLPTLQRFGGLVTLATLSSFFAALLIVPAALAGAQGATSRRALLALRLSFVLLATGAAAAAVSLAARADEPGSTDATATADRIADAVMARPEGTAVRRVIDMTLTDRRGKARERSALVHRVNEGGGRRTRITYLEPKSVRDVTFLSHDDGPGAADDRRWLFMPAARKVRRIPAADRGDYFLGTDFTYEDMQSQLKFDPADYRFEYVGGENGAEGARHRLRGVPVSEDTARELGYGAFEAVIDENSWMPLRIEFFDRAHGPLKTIEVERRELVDGIWTALEIFAHNHQTGHSTRFRFRETEYLESLPPGLFDPDQLSRGLPPSERRR